VVVFSLSASRSTSVLKASVNFLRSRFIGGKLWVCWLHSACPVFPDH
jgi:hypothetical protein